MRVETIRGKGGRRFQTYRKEFSDATDINRFDFVNECRHVRIRLARISATMNVKSIC